MTKVDYAALALALESVVPNAAIVTDPLRAFAYGTDASFYRLNPQIVVIVESEAEVIGVLRLCRLYARARHLPRRGHLALGAGGDGVCPRRRWRGIPNFHL